MLGRSVGDGGRGFGVDREEQASGKSKTHQVRRFLFLDCKKTQKIKRSKTTDFFTLWTL
jgi:hypothetical protein